MRAGLLGGKAIVLADAERPYRRRYSPVLPESRDIPTFDDEFDADVLTRRWQLDDWRRGEGETRWVEGWFRQSTNVRPHPTESGLILGPDQSITLDDAAATFNESLRFGYGQGKLWTVYDGSASDWQPSSGDWNSTTISTGAGTSLCASIADGGSDGFMYSSHADKTIRRWKTGTTENWVGTGATQPTYVPILLTFQGTLYALDGDDLYTLDKTIAATTTWDVASTQVSDTTISGYSSTYLSASDNTNYKRLSKSDVGPIWFQRLDNGQTLIHQYNHYTQTTSQLGKVTADFVYPYDINWFLGFTFVAYRETPEHGEPGDAFLFYQRGGQFGPVGPFRGTSSASTRVHIAGMSGSEILVVGGGAVWAYDFAEGAIFQVADLTSTDEPDDARVFGDDVLIAGVNGGSTAFQCERLDLGTYTTETATIDSGQHNFGFPGVTKLALDVTVYTDPLPADTSYTLSYSLDGASFVAHADTVTTDNSTSYTFTLSTNAAQVRCESFEWRLTLATTNTAQTPTVRRVVTRATSLEKFLEWRLLLATSEELGAVDGQPLSPHQLWEDLKGVVDDNSVVELSDPWSVAPDEAAETVDVYIVEAELPAWDAPYEEAFAAVRLRSRDPQ